MSYFYALPLQEKNLKINRGQFIKFLLKETETKVNFTLDFRLQRSQIYLKINEAQEGFFKPHGREIFLILRW